MPTPRLVVDPSVAIKWYVPEVDSDKARALKQWSLEGSHQIIVPMLFFDEVANILWKKAALRKELQPRVAKHVLWEILRLPFQVYLDRHELHPKTLEYADLYRISAYDAVYLATAVQNNAVLVTADDRLVRRLSAIPLSRRIIALQDWTHLR
jgi:predicted nucleic acid-binding protein